MRPSTVIVYHQHCLDGLAAAWIAHGKLKADGADIHFIPYSHHMRKDAEKEILAQIGPATSLLFVDVAPDRAFLDRLMAAQVSGVQIIDHHKTAAEALSGYKKPADGKSPALDICLDAGHPSAANMVWEKFFPGKKAPDFLKMIAKMDTGMHLETPDDFAAAAAIDTRRISTITDAFASFHELEKLPLAELVALGRHLQADQENRIHKLTDNILYAHLHLPTDGGEINPVWVPVVNADVQNFGRSISDYLRRQGDHSGSGLAFAWCLQGNASVTLSIRSDGTPDASLIAAHLCETMNITGGGHSTSAAVQFVSLAEFSSKITLHTQDVMHEHLRRADTAEARPHAPGQRPKG